MADVQQLSELVLLSIKAAQAPLLERIAGLEQANKDLHAQRDDYQALRDRIVVLETKLALTPHGAVSDAELDALTKDLGALRERVAVVEVLKQIPGPPGQDGKDGKPGRDGLDGLGLSDIKGEFDGAKTLTLTFANGQKTLTVPMTFALPIWRGTYQDGTEYTKGDLITWGGSMWHCNDLQTMAKPSEGNGAWSLVVKRGRDGRDATHG